LDDDEDKEEDEDEYWDSFVWFVVVCTFSLSLLVVVELD
jgi:hypothetical protein